MPSTVSAARGSQLKRATVVGGPYVLVPQCRVINSPDITQEYLDASNHDSTNSFREFIGGFRDGGELPIEIVWHPSIASHVQLYNDLIAQTLLFWQVVLPSANYWQFAGYVSKFNVPLPYDGIITATMSLKVTANPTFT